MNSNTPQNSKVNRAADKVSKNTAGVDPAPRRRIQDGIKSKDPTGKMDLDRRYRNSERRCKHGFVYKGWARRFTIDRRLSTRDRRKKD